MFKNLKKDINFAFKSDPAARTKFEILLTYSGVHALAFYRFSHFLARKRLKLLARLISQFAKFLTGIEIHPNAKIESGIFIDHGFGVVIGETATVEEGVTIYHGVTLGGTGKDTGKRHPTIGNGVMIGSGAKVLGPFKVGDYSNIASGAVVLDEIPPNSTAVGVPARVIKRNGKRVDNLDQVHIPDPVSQEFCRLNAKIDKLEKELAKYKGEEK